MSGILETMDQAFDPKKTTNMDLPSIAGAPTTRLGQKAKEFRQALAQVDTGPLILAPKVIALASEWSEYEAEVEGLAINGWLRRELGAGKTLAWFKRRAEAVDKLGESVRRTLHHEVAVRILGTVPENRWAEIVAALQRARLKNGHCALSPKQADKVIRELLGRAPQVKICARCSALEAEIEALKAKLNDWNRANAKIQE